MKTCIYLPSPPQLWRWSEKRPQRDSCWTPWAPLLSPYRTLESFSAGPWKRLVGVYHSCSRPHYYLYRCCCCCCCCLRLSNHHEHSKPVNKGLWRKRETNISKKGAVQIKHIKVTSLACISASLQEEHTSFPPNVQTNVESGRNTHLGWTPFVQWGIEHCMHAFKFCGPLVNSWFGRTGFPCKKWKYIRIQHQLGIRTRVEKEYT